ncbi:endonuclease/exonuclease/phosphatase family protein [Agarivorans sp. TSD2052]|uniref:endonuclease/exonuclease/phosphatase family protein n=1 Tax=Agarivorans sp. TSD2052 TaxID=2937286 RepID=UPI00200DC270|nr:endonuclease/exonuclease/phosphatase family protein [Agarivorans sp. TSD2052]UPW19805.1 endonuclease/exonuclease/phosphatase family protein [Agarivorans sp. TSD2052]
MKNNWRVLLSKLLLCTFLLVTSWLSHAQLPGCNNQALQYTPPSPDAIQRLNDTEPFTIAVWNSYKGQHVDWLATFTAISQQADFILLQEASRKQLARWSEGPRWHQYQAIAFEWLGDGLGVMNFAKQASIQSCLALSTEPWIRVPKSALLQLYHWQGQDLLLINVHSINFTLSEDDYMKQLQQLGPWLAAYDGAMVLAGDFNTWSEGRLSILEQFISAHQLKTVKFKPDDRTRFFGKALDHIFYRGLRLNSSQSVISESSDHNALLANFSLLRR